MQDTERAECDRLAALHRPVTSIGRKGDAAIIGTPLHMAVVGDRETFIGAGGSAEKTLPWQTLIHIAFLFPAPAIAAAKRLRPPPKVPHP